MNKILVYGYGNPGRQDDGLGPAAVSLLEKWRDEQGFPNIEFDNNFQLNIEDAGRIAEFDIVVFIDASIEDVEDFKLEEVNPSDSRIEFSMHAVSPAFILDLCQKIFDKKPQVYLMHIRGYEFDFEEKLSDKALNNLGNSINFLTKDFLPGLIS